MDYGFWTLVAEFWFLDISDIFSDTSNWFWILVLNGRFLILDTSERFLILDTSERFLILDTSERFWMLDTYCRFLNTCARFCLQTLVADFGFGTVVANFGFSDTSSQFRSVILVNMFLNHLFLWNRVLTKRWDAVVFLFCMWIQISWNTTLLRHYTTSSSCQCYKNCAVCSLIHCLFFPFALDLWQMSNIIRHSEIDLFSFPLLSY